MFVRGCVYVCVYMYVDVSEHVGVCERERARAGGREVGTGRGIEIKIVRQRKEGRRKMGERERWREQEGGREGEGASE